MLDITSFMKEDRNGPKSQETIPGLGYSKNYTAQKNIDKIVSVLFPFCCQKCSVRKLKLYAGVEYKILHHQFFEGNIF